MLALHYVSYIEFSKKCTIEDSLSFFDLKYCINFIMLWSLHKVF